MKVLGDISELEKHNETAFLDSSLSFMRNIRGDKDSFSAEPQNLRSILLKAIDSMPVLQHISGQGKKPSLLILDSSDLLTPSYDHVREWLGIEFASPELVNSFSNRTLFGIQLIMAAHEAAHASDSMLHERDSDPALRGEIFADLSAVNLWYKTFGDTKAPRIIHAMRTIDSTRWGEGAQHTTQAALGEFINHIDLDGPTCATMSLERSKNAFTEIIQYYPGGKEQIRKDSLNDIVSKFKKIDSSELSSEAQEYRNNFYNSVKYVTGVAQQDQLNMAQDNEMVPVRKFGQVTAMLPANLVQRFEM